MHALDAHQDVRAVLVGSVQALVQVQAEGGINQLADVVDRGLQGQVQQRVELGPGGVVGVLGYEQVLLRRGQVHLGLEHVELGLQAHVEKGLGDLELRLQALHRVLGAFHVHPGLQVPQEIGLDGADERQLGLGQVGVVLLLGQDRLLVRVQELEAHEDRLVDVQVAGPGGLVAGDGPGCGLGLLTIAGKAVGALGRGKEVGHGGVDHVIRAQKLRAGADNGRVCRQAALHALLEVQLGGHGLDRVFGLGLGLGKVHSQSRSLCFGRGRSLLLGQGRTGETQRQAQRQTQCKGVLRGFGAHVQYPHDSIIVTGEAAPVAGSATFKLLFIPQAPANRKWQAPRGSRSPRGRPGASPWCGPGPE